MGALGRLRRWWRYRRALDAAIAAYLASGYRVSAAAYDRLREQARREAEEG